MPVKEDKTLVGEEEIRQALSELEGWEYDSAKRELRRVWKFEKFVPTMAFVRPDPFGAGRLGV
jgi:pterin-4a-carbinolamine dehydratase